MHATAAAATPAAPAGRAFGTAAVPNAVTRATPRCRLHESLMLLCGCFVALLVQDASLQ